MHLNLIYDVGMHDGDDTAYYLQRGFRVVAIEADPQLVTGGQKRFAKEIMDGRLKILPIGIGPEEKVVPFWICEGLSLWNSFDRASASRRNYPCHAIDVQCRRFRTVLQEHGVPFFLKVDIEGNDHHCLADLDPKDLPRYISLELTRLEDLIGLRDLGYNRFKIITQNDFSPLQVQPLSFKQWLKVRLARSPFLYKIACAPFRLKHWFWEAFPQPKTGNRC